MGLWWLAGQFQLSANSKTGPLELIVLHPTSFPATPYSSACAHHTHRTERRWELSVEVTTATTTGARVAVFALPDPDWNPGHIGVEMVWAACMNGMGAMAAVTATGRHASRFVLATSTQRLSNALPPTGNYLGYAAAVLVVYLLEPPMALTGSGALTVTVMARVDVTVHNPVPGFLQFTQQPPAPGPTPGPVQSSWAIQLPSGKVSTTIGSTWQNSHTASAWLAGGIYLRLPGTKPTATSDVYITGKPRGFTVYTISVATKNWHNNDSQQETPQYFTLWYEPGSSVCQVVGFNTPENAINQARKQTGLIPHGAECCLIYSGTVQAWSNYFVLPSTGAASISFVEYMATDYSVDVYKNQLSDYDLAASGVAVDLPLRTRPPVGEGWGPAPNLHCESGPTPRSPASSASCCEANSTCCRPWTMSMMRPLLSTMISEMSSQLLQQPTRSCLPSSHQVAPPPQYDERCDAMSEVEAAAVAAQLAGLHYERETDSFEIITECPGCDNIGCEWCFEDCEPVESPV